MPDKYSCPVAVASAAAAASVASGYSTPVGTAPMATQACLEDAVGHSDLGDLGIYGDHVSFFDVGKENLDFETESLEDIFFHAMGFSIDDCPPI